MSEVVTILGIRGIDFVGNAVMLVHLDNDRTFIIPLSKFPTIQNLTDEERANFEVIDSTYLSFLTIDDIFSVTELIGLDK